MARPALLAASFAALAGAIQPGAAPAMPAPMRNLTWGQLNILHTTDTHGWLGGHFHEPQFSADWGDYVSFAERMRQAADARGVDLILVDTGDRVEGNGLYDGSDPKGLYSSDIFREAPIDIICTGNHELYKVATAKREHDVVAGRDFADRYLSSNLDYVDQDSGRRESQSRQRFRRFTTPNQGLDVLAFGFLYDFVLNANNTVVQRVEDAVKQAWFIDEIKKKADVIIVAGHVGLRMDEFRVIYSAIRRLDWFTPVLFFGGHAHVRDAVQIDSKSFSMASGRYLETVGWMSLDGVKRGDDKHVTNNNNNNINININNNINNNNNINTESTFTFSRRYIDNNLYGYHYHTGLNDTTFATDHGRQVSEMITRARAKLDLDHRFGCVPETMWMHRAPYPGPRSVYSWLADHVLADMCVNPDRADRPRLVIYNTGGVRFDVFKGPFTRDTAWTMLPFMNTFRFIPDVPYKQAAKVLPILNSADRILAADTEGGLLPSVAMLGLPEMRNPSPGWTGDDNDGREALHAPELEDQGRRLDQGRALNQGHRLDLRSTDDSFDPPLVGGYTTHDDIGTDGDDTMHSRVSFFAVPNVVQAEVYPGQENGDDAPDTVDLVFVDFVQPWIVPALKMAGGDFSDDHVRPYVDRTTNDIIADWVVENWGDGEC